MTEITLGEQKFSKFLDGRQQVWDASSLTAVQSCPKLYEMKTLIGWQHKKSSIDPLWGSAIHAGMEILDRNRFEGNRKDVAVKEAIAHIIKNFPQLQESEDNKKNLETAVRAIVWRGDEFYDTELIRIAELPDGKPALEVRFECPFPGTSYRISGRIDKVVWLDDQLYIVDTKTTKSGLGDWYFNNFAPAVQVYTYIWAMREVIGLPVQGFIIDAIQTGVNFTRFGRAPFNVSNSQIDEWLRDTTYTLNEVEKYHEKDHWPRMFNSCGNYGGCTFRDICRNSPEHRQGFLDAEFILNPYGTREVTNDSTDN